MFGIGGFELFIILIFAFLIFGPDKLPEIGKTVGRAIAKFREAQQEVNETFGGEKIFDPNNPDQPFKDPIEALDKLAQRQEEKKAQKKAAESGAASASASTSENASDASDSADEAAPKQESFTERKARYERERAARKAAEAEAATGVNGRTVKAPDPASSDETVKASASGVDGEADSPAAEPAEGGER